MGILTLGLRFWRSWPLRVSCLALQALSFLGMSSLALPSVQGRVLLLLMEMTLSSYLMWEGSAPALSGVLDLRWLTTRHGMTCGLFLGDCTWSHLSAGAGMSRLEEIIFDSFINWEL